MNIRECQLCGGMHIGSYSCPFETKPCVVCGSPCVLACSDCAIEGSVVPVCNRKECRLEHDCKHLDRYQGYAKIKD
jgi:hypothetical protein